MKNLSSVLFPRSPGARADVALLAVRLVMGAAFLSHGWSKIQNPFGWMGPTSGTPAVFQALAAISEFGGGIALIAGLVVPLASLGLISTMTVAVYTHLSRGDSFVGKGSTYEPALVYLVIAVLFAFVGPGRFSLDALIGARLRTGASAPSSASGIAAVS